MSLADSRWYTLDRFWYRLRSDHMLIYLQSILTFIIVWALVARLFQLEGLISSPTEVGAAVWELFISGEWRIHYFATMRHLFVGFAYAMGLGTVLGILMSVNEHVDAFFRNWVIVGMSLPGLFVVVFAAMWFGLGDIVPIVAVAVTLFPYVALMLTTEVDNIDPGLFEMSSAFDISQVQVVRHVIMPAATGAFFSAARFTISIGWKEVMLAEFIAARNAEGVGAQIAIYLTQLSLPGILKWALLVMVTVALIQFVLFKRIEEWLFDWREDVSVL